jgi:hypothetical protein
MSNRYGGHLRFRSGGNLDHATALHWVLHSRAGAAARDRLGLPASEVADLLVHAAAMQPTEKQKDDNMQDFHKTLREVGEHGFVKMVTRYAKTVHPTLSREQAFTKVFMADDAEGLAIRKCWQISKQGRSAPLDDDEAGDEARDVEGDALDELRRAHGNALAALERLAVEARRLDPKLTKAQSFAKVYSANPELAAAERRQNRPRA